MRDISSKCIATITLLGFCAILFTSADELSATSANGTKAEANLTIGELVVLAVSENSQPSCDTSANCTEPYQICMNRQCGCKPDYV